jgi:hypothetical protein
MDLKRGFFSGELAGFFAAINSVLVRALGMEGAKAETVAKPATKTAVTFILQE